MSKDILTIRLDWPYLIRHYELSLVIELIEGKRLVRFGGINRQNYLFSSTSIFDLIRGYNQSIHDEINGMPEQRFLNTSVEDLIHYYDQRFRIEIPSLDVENAIASQQETEVQVSGFGYGLGRDEYRMVKGVQVTLEIPFSGDGKMFQIQPSTHTMSPPQAGVDMSSNKIMIWHSGVSLEPEQVQRQFDSTIEEIQRHLGWMSGEVNAFNSQIRDSVKSLIESRRDKLLKNQNILAGLKFNLKPRSDAPTTYAAPIHKKRVTPSLPPASTTPYKPEPILQESDYQNILKIISDMTLVMERSPSAFVQMGEEDIRQHFLVQLNGQYEGKATGETFNYSGKTDILIRDDGKNIFIAECKFWRGEQVYLDTITQILSYLSWRDTKTALIVFNRNKNLSAVLQKIEEVTQKHELFKSGPKVESETRFRYIFGQKDDPARQVTLTVLVFDIPSSEHLNSSSE